MATLMDATDLTEQTPGVAAGLLNEGAPRTPETNRGPLDVLFPTGPYAGVPGLDLKSLRRSQLMDLGARLLASSGPKPAGTSSALADVGGALGGAMESWQQRLPQAANAAMQLQQYQYQMAGRQALMRAMTQEGQLQADASPTAAVAWYSKMARRMAEAGPAGLPYASQFANLAETQHRALGDLKYEDGVLSPTDVQANPQLQQFAGQYGAIGRDPQTGAPVVFQAKPRLTPEQSTRIALETRSKFADEIKPGNNAALAYQAFKNINPGDTSRAADMQRSQLAARMLGEGGTVPGLSPVETKDLKEMVAELFTNAGRLDAASRQRYAASVEKAAEYWRRHNKAILDYYTNTAPEGVDTKGFTDEWAAMPSQTPPPPVKPKLSPTSQAIDNLPLNPR